MTTIGAIFLPSNPPESLRSVAQAADQAGLEELWIWEDCFLNGGLTAATAALAWTENLRVGIGIMPVPFRNVASLAMELATLGRMFGDRALPGIGHGVQDWMGQVGARAASPLTLLREYATALQSLLRGESVTVDGKYVKLDNVRLDWPPAVPPVLSVAAGGPKTIALAGEVGDQVVLAGGTSPAKVAAAAQAITDAGITVFVPAMTGPGAEAKLVADMAKYGADWPGLWGSPAEIAAGLQEFVAAGAGKLILQTVAGEDPEAYVRWVAEEIKPLLA
ncbi:LLM class flavin-dependent oxidoreductase [Actinoplanes sp. TRM 88003]|uniref:LLM class flavin-dependent oxidoreductase n=1 Tax=Paractinoplanes aksuensis TaxID=2939490 RepID=A0ABT1DRP7_9ACTN|nr:LLM class flavin-dependent oxidoreductase [Actinoplanes aksuensis]MCO8272751.1 LLM class flavin-dependent oxidoreductase [Actinoplanes aksuensis]